MNREQTGNIRLLLVILANLKKHDVVKVDELAKQLGIDSSTLRENLQTLLYVGVPPFGGGDNLPIEIEYDADEQAEYLCVKGEMPASIDSSLSLSSDEVKALILAVQIAGCDLDGALVAKIYQAVSGSSGSSSGSQSSVQQLKDSIQIPQLAHTPEVFSVVSLALENEAVLLLDYTNQAGVESVRQVTPIALFIEVSEWYLRAFCHKATQYRTFKLAGINGAELIEQSGDCSSADSGEISSSSKAENLRCLTALNLDGNEQVCRIRFSNPQDYQPLDWPHAQTRKTTAGFEIDLPYVSEDWVAHKVVALHGKAKVTTPPSLVEKVKQLALKKIAGLESLQ